MGYSALHCHIFIILYKVALTFEYVNLKALRETTVHNDLFLAALYFHQYILHSDTSTTLNFGSLLLSEGDVCTQNLPHSDFFRTSTADR